MDINIDVLLRIGEIASIIGGGYVIAFRLGIAINSMKESIRAQKNAQESHSTEIKELKQEVKKMATILTTLAVQEQRLNQLEKYIDDLRRGRGYIEPPDFIKSKINQL